MKHIYGIIPPIITPFDAEGKLDVETLKRETEYYIASGVHGLSFAGSTGEGSTLSADELYQGISTIRAMTDMPLVCGVIRNCTQDALEAGLAAKEAGADTLMVTPKFYFSNDDAGNYAFYEAICRQVALPVIVYNVIAANPISAELLAKMSDIPHMFGVKQSVGGLHALGETLRLCEKKLQVFGAQDDLCYVSFAMGAVGSISAVHAVFPRESVAMWDAVQAGDLKQAKIIQQRTMPIVKLCGQVPFPNGYREAAAQLGCPVGLARHPLLPVSAAYTDRMTAELKAYQFIK